MSLRKKYRYASRARALAFVKSLWRPPQSLSRLNAQARRHTSLTDTGIAALRGVTSRRGRRCDDRPLLTRGMNRSLHMDTRTVAAVAALAAIGLALLGKAKPPLGANPPQRHAAAPRPDSAKPNAVVDLSPSQLSAITVQPLAMHGFPIEKDAAGSIDN